MWSRAAPGFLTFSSIQQKRLSATVRSLVPASNVTHANSTAMASWPPRRNEKYLVFPLSEDSQKPCAWWRKFRSSVHHPNSWGGNEVTNERLRLAFVAVITRDYKLSRVQNYEILPIISTHPMFAAEIERAAWPELTSCLRQARAGVQRTNPTPHICCEIWPGFQRCSWREPPS